MTVKEVQGTRNMKYKFRKSEMQKIWNKSAGTTRYANRKRKWGYGSTVDTRTQSHNLVTEGQGQIIRNEKQKLLIRKGFFLTLVIYPACCRRKRSALTSLGWPSSIPCWHGRTTGLSGRCRYTDMDENLLGYRYALYLQLESFRHFILHSAYRAFFQTCVCLQHHPGFLMLF